MPEDGKERRPLLVCEACGQEIKPINYMDIIAKVMTRLKKETGYGEKPKK